MKILQLGKFYPVRGGVEKVMYDLTAGLASEGVDCDMMCAASTGHGHTYVLSAHARLLTRRTWVKAAATTIAPSMVHSLRRMASRYDIIHVHHPDPMAALALYLSGFKGPVVLHWHSDIVKQKHLFKFYKPLQSWLLKRASVVVGTTGDYIAASPHLKKVHHKTQCVPIGVDAVQPDEAGAEELRKRFPGKKIIFFMGRLITYKGLEYLIDAAALLPDDYVVVIGGEGPLEESLRQRIADAGLEGKVVLEGRIPEDRVARYYTACSLFCLPSVMPTEAFGIVQIEAMSAAKPVVATRIKGSGTAWVNSHGQSGLNVEPRDAEALARAITDICGDRATYEKYCRGARERFEQVFEKKLMINKMLNIYRSLL